jgi:hypothetical protein
MPKPAAKRQRLAKPRYESVKRDLLTLPQELVYHIFSFLDAADLTTCARVSTKWYAAANDEQVSRVPSLNTKPCQGPLLISPWIPAVETFISISVSQS